MHVDPTQWNCVSLPPILESQDALDKMTVPGGVEPGGHRAWGHQLRPL